MCSGTGRVPSPLLQPIRGPIRSGCRRRLCPATGQDGSAGGGWPRAGARGYNDGPEDRAMPLRDHFRPPLDKKTSWEGFHGSWPAVIVMALNRELPPRYLAEPRVHLGVSMEIDVTAFDKEMPAPTVLGFGGDEGGVATV